MDNPVDHLNRALEGLYEILEEAGRGGMAVVYRARDLRHDRDVALKVLAPEVAAVVGPQRFLREIRIAASLQHANIVPLYDSGDADGLLYFVMPFLGGETLGDKIRREGPLPVDETLTIAREIAAALDFAHKSGLVHRDIKPGNVLFLNGQGVLADFGLATAFADAEQQELTQSGVVLGTPSYMSPEQAVGQCADTKSDIYSLGCVVYEMLAGDPPFHGTSAQAVLARHVADQIPPVRSVRPQLPPGIDLTLSKALAKVPADRFQSASDFVDALSTVPSPTKSRRGWVAVGGVLFVAALVLLVGRPWESSVRLIPTDPVRKTFSAGPEYSPTLSPDARLLAYSHTEHGTMDIMIQSLQDGSPPWQLTDGEGDELLARWSREGSTDIAYVRGNGWECDIYTISLLDQTPRKLAATNIPHIHAFWDEMECLGTYPWSLGDESLIFSRRLEAGGVAICEVDCESGEVVQLTTPTPPGAHDLGASWSKDGSLIVFARSHGGAQELWLYDVATGTESRVLPDDPPGIVNQEPSFLPGGEFVIFTSDRSGTENVWSLHIASKTLTRLTFGTGRDWYPSVSAAGEITYTQWSHTTHLYRVNVETGVSEQVNGFSQDNFVGRYSPTDMSRIAYQSTRTGNAEIYTVDLETKVEKNLSDHSGTDLVPEWSPDGEEIVFISNRDGVMNIMVIDSSGNRPPERLSDQEIHVPSKVWAVSLSLRWTPPDQLPQSIGYVMADAQGPSLWMINRHGSDAGERKFPGVLRFDWYKDRHHIVYTTMTETGVELRAADMRRPVEDSVLLWAGPHSEMILAPDGSSVAFVKSASHFNQSLYRLKLESPTTSDGLPSARGEPELIIHDQGIWHVHNGGWSPDGQWIVYTQDTDEGDIFSLNVERE